MNVSEYIVSFLEERQIDRVFGVVGGAALWICKALNESTKIKPVFTNHEQAATMAADGWARITGKPGVVFTINGPGMTNTVTGIAQAWVDSSPVILICGNSNLKSVQYERENNVRQYGTQDVRTDKIMESITKKIFLLEKAEEVRVCLEEAYETAVSGRPGPVCIEVPINIQSAEVPEQLEGWVNGKFEEFNTEDIKDVLAKLVTAKRPLILAGQGIRLAGAVDEFRQFVATYEIPVVNSRMGIDTITSDSKYFVGRAGNHGSRASHFALQTCDVLLVLGSRMAPNTTGYDVSKFSGQSYKILIDIDEHELEKFNLVIEHHIRMDIKKFLKEAITLEKIAYKKEIRDKWVTCCLDWRKRYPIMQKEYYDNETISTYRLVEIVSNQAQEEDLIISDTGSCCSIVAQEWQIKGNQRLFISGGLSAMGYWATSMGLSIANEGNGQVICFVGDGSLQMNIHELATIKQYGMPIKLFVVSNDGYQFVKMSQSGYGINPAFGADVAAGVPIPNIHRVVEAYGLHYSCCMNKEELEDAVQKVLQSSISEVCEIFVDEEQEVCPRLKSVALEDGTFVSPNYENLYPFLDKDILEKEIQNAYWKK